MIDFFRKKIFVRAAEFSMLNSIWTTSSRKSTTPTSFFLITLLIVTKKLELLQSPLKPQTTMKKREKSCLTA